MNLHANAALSLKGRRELCRGVVERERTLAQAAEAAGVSVRAPVSGLVATKPRERSGFVIGPRRRVGSASHQRAAGRGDRRAEAVAVHRLGDRRGVGDGALDRLGDPRQDRDGQARPGWPRARRAVRARASRRADPHRHQEAGRIERGAGARITGMANRGSRPRRTDALGVSRQIAGWEYVHIAIDDCTRLAYAEVLPDQRTKHRHRIPHPSSRSTPATASPFSSC